MSLPRSSHLPTRLLHLLLINAIHGGFVSTLFLIASCAPSREALVYPLKDSTVVSADRELRLRVPEGWFVPVDGDAASGLLFWLVKEDYLATMGLEEIRADETVRKNLSAERLEALGQLSFSLKKSRDTSASILRGPDVFRLNKKNFCSYEYSLDKGARTVRTVVFSTSKKIYELTAFPSPRKAPSVMQPVFDAQQAILQTIEW